VAHAIATGTPGSRVRRALIFAGLLLLIVHCRPWSYSLFADAREWQAPARSPR
jgi:hypothetical protein